MIVGIRFQCFQLQAHGWLDGIEGAAKPKSTTKKLEPIILVQQHLNLVDATYSRGLQLTILFTKTKKLCGRRHRVLPCGGFISRAKVANHLFYVVSCDTLKSLLSMCLVFRLQ